MTYYILCIASKNHYVNNVWEMKLTPVMHIWRVWDNLQTTKYHISTPLLCLKVPKLLVPKRKCHQIIKYKMVFDKNYLLRNEVCSLFFCWVVETHKYNLILLTMFYIWMTFQLSEKKVWKCFKYDNTNIKWILNSG